VSPDRVSADELAELAQAELQRSIDREAVKESLRALHQAQRRLEEVDRGIRQRYRMAPEDAIGRDGTIQRGGASRAG
jgi:hypothetical protein